jgi:hypothetical protein
LFVIAYSFTIGSWSLGIGDPSLMGWFTVFSYYFTASICFLKMFSQRVRQHKQEWIFWGIICFSMVVLGIIKQFNLLTAMTEIGRIIARSHAWIEQRSIVQAWTMAIVGVIFLITMIRVLQIPVLANHSITIVGLIYLLIFVIFRGISLHQFEVVLNYEILGARINWIAELIGIYCICLSIFLYPKPIHRKYNDSEYSSQ